MVAETILIIEDDPTMLRVLKDNFEYSGFAVKTAGDGDRVCGRPSVGKST
jgi:DNA-binding response OmpR family regulator